MAAKGWMVPTGAPPLLPDQVLAVRQTRVQVQAALAGLTELWSLSLARNQIRNVGPLAGLAKLRSLSLARNQVTDISPLLGFSSLVDVNLRSNPLDEASRNVHIPALRARGVEVTF